MTGLYGGDISPSKTMEMLKSDPTSVLVDVRTFAEWHYVGTPDLRSIGKDIIKIEWRTLPNMDLNEKFVNELENKITDKDQTILFLCRTGGRSREAAITMTAKGYTNCYNIEDGFEGSLDPRMHRGTLSGWKAEKLPWGQE